MLVLSLLALLPNLILWLNKLRVVALVADDWIFVVLEGQTR